MANDPIRELVEQKIATDEATPEWIMASVAMQILAVLRSIDERLEGIDSALAPDIKGHSIASDIAYELKTLGRMFQRAFPDERRS